MKQQDIRNAKVKPDGTGTGGFLKREPRQSSRLNEVQTRRIPLPKGNRLQTSACCRNNPVKTLRIGDASKAVSAFDKKLGLKKEGAGKCSRPFFIGWQVKKWWR
jgi:hypothetical protein